MKKLKFTLILIFPIFICSCIVNPDQMLDAYNDQLLEDIGGGMYQQGEVIINPDLIPKDVYPALEHGTFRLEVSQAYYDYTWTLKNNVTGAKQNINGTHIVYVGRPDIELKEGEKYTLTLNLINKNGVKYMDTATISVVK